MQAIRSGQTGARSSKPFRRNTIRNRSPFILCAYLVVSFLGCSEKTFHVEHSPPVVISESDRIDLLNEELGRPGHPLRNHLEVLLAMRTKTGPTPLKRKLRSLTALDPEGKRIEIRWDEYQYKAWGGYFFDDSRKGIVQVDRNDDQWKVASFFHDTPLRFSASDRRETDVPMAEADVLIRHWSRETGRFDEFDESLYPRRMPETPSVVIIHGMGESFDRPWIVVLAERIAAVEPETNIFSVDWSRYSKPESLLNWRSIVLPVSTAGRIPDVAEKANGYLFADEGLALSPTRTHLIGFSHGAHVGGLIGASQHGTIKRLTILDPSTRKVHWNSKNRFGEGWNAESARFIDMYRTSGWAGTGKARGYRVFYVLEKGCDPRATLSTYADHLYAPKWFASTVGGGETGFGYSIASDDSERSPDEAGWTGLIVSTLPKQGDRSGMDDATSKLVPFPRKNGKIEWSRDDTMYKELTRVTDMIVREFDVSVSSGKQEFSYGDSAELRLVLDSGFDRSEYFTTGIWGFARDRLIPGRAWLSDADELDTEKAIPLTTGGMWKTADLEFRMSKEEGATAEVVASVRLPKRQTIQEKFGRSEGDFFLHVDIGGVLGENKSVYDLNEGDNIGVARIRFVE